VQSRLTDYCNLAEYYVITINQQNKLRNQKCYRITATISGYCSMNNDVDDMKQ